MKKKELEKINIKGNNEYIEEEDTGFVKYAVDENELEFGKTAGRQGVTPKISKNDGGEG